MSKRKQSAALTMVELVVCLAIVAVMMMLLLPAVQQAREKSRDTTCQNNLRQLSFGLAAHESAYGHFPSGGWGFQWVGDPDRGSGRSQCGGWIFALLPFVEKQNVHEMARSVKGAAKKESLGKMLQTPISLLICPSRRRAELRPFLGQYPLHNAITPSLAAKTDYAGCGGDAPTSRNFGPSSDSIRDVAEYHWPNPQRTTGVFFAGSVIRVADVIDGLSNTYMVGEKYVRMRQPSSAEDRDFGDDQAAYIGDDRDLRRWTEAVPHRDARALDSPDIFGSRHPAAWSAVFGDGSVRRMAFAIDAAVHRALGNRQDGLPANVP